MSDATYLQTLEIEIQERYPRAFEEYLNIQSQVSRKAVVTLSKELETKSSEIAELRSKLEQWENSKPALESMLQGYHEIERQLNQLSQDTELKNRRLREQFENTMPALESMLPRLLEIEKELRQLSQRKE